MRYLMGLQNIRVCVGKFAWEFNVSMILLRPEVGGLPGIGIGF